MTPLVSGLTLIDLAVVAAVLLVLPATLGGRWRWWAIAAATTAAACLQERGTGSAVALALPWVVLVGGRTVAVLRDAGPPFFWTLRDGVRVVSCAYAGVSVGGFVVSRAGLSPFGIHEPIVELTAVHFVYAGPGALALAGAAWAAADTPRTRRLGVWALALTAGAPPVVATGFLTGAALPQVGGALLMTLGVFATATLELHRSVTSTGPAGMRLLLALSGIAVWAPMALAVAWAAGQHWDVPSLSIHDMARTHGAGNALGFIGAGLIALRVDHSSKEVQAWR